MLAEFVTGSSTEFHTIQEPKNLRGLKFLQDLLRHTYKNLTRFEFWAIVDTIMEHTRFFLAGRATGKSMGRVKWNFDHADAAMGNAL